VLDRETHMLLNELAERGLRSPSIRTLVRMAHVLKVTPSEVVRRMEVMLDKQKEHPIGKYYDRETLEPRPATD
jgi:transcriptional regulator with XRE-family HTH domain